MTVSIISEKFYDFDHFRNVLLGWDVDVTQLSSGPFHLTLQQVGFDTELSLTHLISNGRFMDRMAIDHGRVTFVVCFSPNIFCGLEVPSGSMLIFGPGREYRSILPETFESFEICASVDYLKQAGINIGDESFDDLRPERSVLNLTDHYLSEFRRLSLAYSKLATDQAEESLHPTLWTEAARERAISLVLGALRVSGRAIVPPMTTHLSSWLLTARALDHIDRLGSQKETVATISQSLGCSTRALQSAFQTILGMSPLQYILARRLQLARRSLFAAKPDSENVTRIAAEHEFFHFGRFSQYYRALFGERPSDTLKRALKITNNQF